jgi:5'-3' exonuclease
LGVDSPAGFPTLQTLKHVAKLENIGTKVFNIHSDKESLIIVLKEDNTDTNIKMKDAKENILAKTCYLWPYNRECLVVGLNDGNRAINFKRPEILPPKSFKE